MGPPESQYLSNAQMAQGNSQYSSKTFVEQGTSQYLSGTQMAQGNTESEQNYVWPDCPPNHVCAAQNTQWLTIAATNCYEWAQVQCPQHSTPRSTWVFCYVDGEFYDEYK